MEKRLENFRLVSVLLSGDAVANFTLFSCGSDMGRCCGASRFMVTLFCLQECGGRLGGEEGCGRRSDRLLMLI